MSVSNYGELKSAVGLWLNRADLTAYSPDLIRLGEQRIFYGADDPYPSNPLRIPAMQTQETGTITSSTIAFPTRFLEPIRIAATNGNETWSLVYVAPERYSEQSNSSGLPAAYTYLNNSLMVGGSESASYTLDYYQAFASLSADADYNWVLTNAPGVYLYAALIESAPFLGDPATLNQWVAMFKSSINALNRSTKYLAGGTLATRVVK
jgi:hypothetical protein